LEAELEPALLVESPHDCRSSVVAITTTAVIVGKGFMCVLAV
jgi:hypothetical protein